MGTSVGAAVGLTLVGRLVGGGVGWMLLGAREGGVLGSAVGSPAANNPEDGRESSFLLRFTPSDLLLLILPLSLLFFSADLVEQAVSMLGVNSNGLSSST